MKIRKSLLAIAAALSLLLTACAATAPVPGEETKPAEAATEQAAADEASQKKDDSEKKEFLQRAREIGEYQEKVEAEAESQMQMNQTSGEVYEKWKDLHDDIYDYLGGELNEAQLDELKKEESEWLERRDKALEKADKDYEGGSMAPMMHNTTASEYYKTRCYELIAMIG